MKLNLGGGASHLLTPFPKHFKEVSMVLGSKNLGNTHSVYYVDSDNDRIDLSEDEDLREAARYARMKGLPRLEVLAETKVPNTKRNEE